VEPQDSYDCERRVQRLGPQVLQLIKPVLDPAQRTSQFRCLSVTTHFFVSNPASGQAEEVARASTFRWIN